MQKQKRRRASAPAWLYHDTKVRLIKCKRKLQYIRDCHITDIALLDEIITDGLNKIENEQ